MVAVGDAQVLKVVEKDGGASLSCASQKPLTSAFASDRGMGNATRPASLITVDSGSTPSATMLKMPGYRDRRRA